MPKSEPIKRDVGEQAKGARLQKLRAVELLLETLDRQGPGIAFCAIENDGDVYLKEADQTGSKEYHEEDKNYDTDGKFTLASDPVINTLVIFADCWIRKSCSDAAVFGFYAPNVCGKERVSDRSKRLLVEWPDKPMLELLQARNFTDARTLRCAKTYVLDDYRIQYPEKTPPDGTPRGHLAVLESWSDDQWQAFFGQITWKLGQEDHVLLQQTLAEKVRRCRHFTRGIAGREMHVISLMCDLLDQRQSLSDPNMRFVYASDLEVIFLRLASGTHKLPDPSYKTWEELPKPEDTRNLADKVRAICKAATRAEIGRWSRRAANSLNAQLEYADDLTLRALMWQVFDVCEEKLDELRKRNAGKELTSEELAAWVEILVKCCEERLKDCSQHFAYTISGTTFIAELIWSLVGSCFLAFDTSAA